MAGAHIIVAQFKAVIKAAIRAPREPLPVDPGPRAGLIMNVEGAAALLKISVKVGDVRVVDAEVVRGIAPDPQVHEPKLVALGLVGRVCELGDIEHGRHDQELFRGSGS